MKKESVQWEKEIVFGFSRLQCHDYLGYLATTGIASRINLGHKLGRFAPKPFNLQSLPADTYSLNELADARFGLSIMDLDIDIITLLNSGIPADQAEENFQTMEPYLLKIAERSQACFFINSSELSTHPRGVPFYMNPHLALSFNGRLIKRLCQDAAGSSIVVLVVDDEMTNRELVAMFVESFGYSTRQAKDPAHAIEILRTESIDLIISDVNMGEATGIDLAVQVADEFPSISVVLMTGWATKEQRQQIQSMGLLLLDKPVDPSELQEVIQRSLLKSRSKGSVSSILSVAERIFSFMKENKAFFLAATLSLAPFFGMAFVGTGIEHSFKNSSDASFWLEEWILSQPLWLVLCKVLTSVVVIALFFSRALCRAMGISGENVFLSTTMRLIDLFVTVVIAIPAIGMIFFCSLFTALVDRQNPFFLCMRKGLEGKDIRVLKLRTMKDGQVTSLGSVLRMSGIDELPQVLNLLKGEMSVFGPRNLKPRSWKYRKPGLLGIFSAIVGGGNMRLRKDGPSAKFEKDLLALERRSWSTWLAWKIVAAAIHSVFFRKAYAKRAAWFGVEIPLEIKEILTDRGAKISSVIHQKEKRGGLPLNSSFFLALSKGRPEVENPSSSVLEGLIQDVIARNRRAFLQVFRRHKNSGLPWQTFVAPKGVSKEHGLTPKVLFGACAHSVSNIALIAAHLSKKRGLPIKIFLHQSTDAFNVVYFHSFLVIQSGEEYCLVDDTFLQLFDQEFSEKGQRGYSWTVLPNVLAQERSGRGVLAQKLFDKAHSRMRMAPL
ncbi:MAG TPA: sugar transferase, partial [Candidatus Omnitrophota bacterium]|nr:sugar transferase [Candidatus Omnitrophota bacterium]